MQCRSNPAIVESSRATVDLGRPISSNRGCMELSLIIDTDDGVIPGFDTTRIHAIVAVDAAMDYLRVRGPALESRFSRAGQSSTSPLNVNEDTPSTS